MNLDAIGLWLGRAVMASFAALVAAELLRYFRTALSEPAAPRRPGERMPLGKLFVRTLVALVASRLSVVAVCAACYWLQRRTLSGFFQEFAWKLTPWDASHYLGLIERWYVTEGDARLHIVFLPFYPAVCRGLRLLTGMSPFAAALTVSNLALVGCGMALARLAEMDGDEATALRAMLLLMFSPMTYFYSVPYTESLFLLLTLLAVLFARRRQFALAVAFGAMAANTRVVGMAVAIPIFWELLRCDRERRGERLSAREIALDVAKVLPIGAGLLLYLWGNYRLFGNPTQFLIFQCEHWSQSFGSMANTFSYSLANALNYEDFLYRLGVWWPQVLLLIAAPAALLWRRREEPAGDVAYLLVFHYVSFAPTWLLSGPRYLSAAYALYPLLARIPKGKRGAIVLLAGNGLLFIYMTVVGLWFGKVY